MKCLTTYLPTYLHVEEKLGTLINMVMIQGRNCALLSLLGVTALASLSIDQNPSALISITQHHLVIILSNRTFC